MGAIWRLIFHRSPLNLSTTAVANSRRRARQSTKTGFPTPMCGPALLAMARTPRAFEKFLAWDASRTPGRGRDPDRRRSHFLSCTRARTHRGASRDERRHAVLSKLIRSNVRGNLEYRQAHAGL